MNAMKNLPVDFAPINQHTGWVQPIEFAGTPRESRSARSVKPVKFQPRRGKEAPFYMPSPRRRLFSSIHTVGQHTPAPISRALISKRSQI
jgi:hypothetical protein